MKIVIIDGQGGQLGALLVKEVTTRIPGAEITAIGTNALATSAMLKAGASRGATGENPVIVACRRAEVILGPIGIVIPDSMLGEVTPKMALAIGQADAVRILIPMNKCENLVAGVQSVSLGALVADAVEKLHRIAEEKNT